MPLAMHSPMSSSTNSVVIMEMPKVLSSSSSPTLLQLFTNETNRCPSGHLLSIASNRLCSYPPLVMDLLRDPTHAHILHSCRQTVQVHTVLISVAASPIRIPLFYNSNHVLLLSVHTPYATTEDLTAAPVHHLMVALVLILPPNGRDLRFLRIPRAWTNECRASGGSVQVKKNSSLVS